MLSATAGLLYSTYYGLYAVRLTCSQGTLAADREEVLDGIESNDL